YGLFQVRRVEAFGEPAVDGREEIAGFGALDLVAPEASEAGRGAEFPPSCTLSSRNREALLQARLCSLDIAASKMRKQRGADHVHFRHVTLVANLYGGCKRQIHLFHTVGIASALEIDLCQQAYCTREINASAEPVPDTEPFLKVTYTLSDIAALRQCPSE